MKKLTVLANPYYGHNNGKDSHDNYFSSKTNFTIPTPEGRKIPDNIPCYYVHGNIYGLKKDTIGIACNPRQTPLGIWYDVVLDDTPFNEELYNASSKGQLYASSGAIPASVEVGENGEIISWANAELSLIDLSKVNPANMFAFAIKYIKEIGITDMNIHTQIMALVSQLYNVLSNYNIEELEPENKMDDDTEVKCSCNKKAETMSGVINEIKTQLRKITDTVEADSNKVWLEEAVKSGKVKPEEIDAIKEQLTNPTVASAIKAVIDVRKPDTPQLNILPLATKTDVDIDSEYLNRMRKFIGIKNG